MNAKKCLHECDIYYHDLVQMNGQPYYRVICKDCDACGTIHLEEGENCFDFTKKEWEEYTIEDTDKHDKFMTKQYINRWTDSMQDISNRLQVVFDDSTLGDIKIIQKELKELQSEMETINNI